MPVIAVKAQRDGHVSLPLHPPHTIPPAAYFRGSDIYSSIDKQCVNIIWKEKLSIRRWCDQNIALGVWSTCRLFFPPRLWIVWLSLPGISDAGLQNTCQPSLGPEIGHWRFPLLRCVNAPIVRKLSPRVHTSRLRPTCVHVNDKP